MREGFRGCSRSRAPVVMALPVGSGTPFSTLWAGWKWAVGELAPWSTVAKTHCRDEWLHSYPVHELRVAAEGTTSLIQAAEMRFLWRMSGLSLKHRTQSIRNALSNFSPCRNVNQLRWLGHRTKIRDRVFWLAWEPLGLPLDKLAAGGCCPCGTDKWQ